jgi:hypothetical protein
MKVHLQPKAAERLGHGLCASKGCDRFGCRVQPLVILTFPTNSISNKLTIELPEKAAIRIFVDLSNQFF